MSAFADVQIAPSADGGSNTEKTCSWFVIVLVIGKLLPTTAKTETGFGLDIGSPGCYESHGLLE
jgi:hypothetical protein